MGVRLVVAFAAGFASVITPCVLPLVPGYLSALSSVEPGRLDERANTRRIVIASLPFILGFTVVFVALGAGAAAIGRTVSPDAQTEIAGFVDDARALTALPARHDLWRRRTCGWLARKVEAGFLEEEEARRLAWELAYGLVRRAYRVGG